MSRGKSVAVAAALLMATVITVDRCSAGAVGPNQLAGLAPGAGAQEFRWIDSQGRQREARTPDEVPRHDWRGVTMQVRGAEATSGERFRTAEGITVVIEGVQAPSLDDDGTIVSEGGQRARERLDELVNGVAMTLEFEGDRRLPDGSFLAHPVLEGGRLLAETLLSEGVVRLCIEEDARRHAEVLRAAQAQARSAQAGLWAKAPAPRPPEPRIHRGISLGLFGQSPDHDYSGFLDEIVDVGATHVLINMPWLMEDWQSNDFGPVAGRTAGWPAVKRVTEQARARGLGVAYLPLVLLRTGTVEHWRGDIAPTQRWLWFRNYNRFMGRWADMAEDLGVSLLCIGSEFTTLEREFAAWRGIVANVRSRYGGNLTYSANWDHLEALDWSDLDVVGMTGYHSLTRKDDPTVAELAAAWAPIKEKLLRFQQKVNKPILFTEIGYPSQNGCNRNPWDYFHDTTKPDHREQADCFEALFRIWEDASAGFKGMYIWNWWRHAAPDVDVGYSVFGKPAWSHVKGYFATLASREPAMALAHGTNGDPAESRAASRPAGAPEVHPRAPQSPESRPRDGQ